MLFLCVSASCVKIYLRVRVRACTCVYAIVRYFRTHHVSVFEPINSEAGGTVYEEGTMVMFAAEFTIKKMMINVQAALTERDPASK